MHPYGYSSWSYRPSRFIWFTIGAVAATLWMNKDRVRSGYCHRPPSRPSSVPFTTEAPSDPSGVPRDMQWNEREHTPLLSRQTEDKVSSRCLHDTSLLTVELFSAGNRIVRGYP
jgi:hypothetical protein